MSYREVKREIWWWRQIFKRAGFRLLLKFVFIIMAIQVLVMLPCYKTTYKVKYKIEGKTKVTCTCEYPEPAPGYNEHTWIIGNERVATDPNTKKVYSFPRTINPFYIIHVLWNKYRE